MEHKQKVESVYVSSLSDRSHGLRHMGNLQLDIRIRTRTGIYIYYDSRPKIYFKHSTNPRWWSSYWVIDFLHVFLWLLFAYKTRTHRIHRWFRHSTIIPFTVHVKVQFTLSWNEADYNFLTGNIYANSIEMDLGCFSVLRRCLAFILEILYCTVICWRFSPEQRRLYLEPNCDWIINTRHWHLERVRFGSHNSQQIYHTLRMPYTTLPVKQLSTKMTLLQL